MSTEGSVPSELGIPALRAGLATIEKYLFANGKDRSMAARALVAMHGVAARMVTGSYPFEPNEALDLAQLGKKLDEVAMTIVTVRPAASFSLTVPAGMAYGGWYEDVWMPLLKQMGPDGGSRPPGSHGVELHAHLYETEHARFVDSESRRRPASEVGKLVREWGDLFRTALPFAAWRQSAFPYDVDSGYAVGQVLEANLSYPLQLLGLFALAGYGQGVDKMEALAGVLMDCIPVGTNADNVWVIATA